MIRCFIYGTKGGSIIADNKDEALKRLNDEFGDKFLISKEATTTAGFVDISFVIHTKAKYNVDVISKECKFYELNNESGERLATIEYDGWCAYYKYRVSFSYKFVKDNLNKEREFHTLKEAKQYVEKILNQ